MVKIPSKRGSKKIAIILLILCILGLTFLGTIFLAKGLFYQEYENSLANTPDETYTITYNLDGGALTQINKTEYTSSTATFTLNNPIKIGYEFIGWTGTDLNYMTKTVTISKGSYGDRSYIAHYKVTTYTVSYNLMGGVLSSNNVKTYTIEDDSFTLNNPTKKGYIFDGWTGTDIEEPTQTVVVPSGSHGNRAYTANFSAVEYTISYDLDGGEADNPTSYTVDDEFTLTNPVKDDYDFTGWTGTNISSSKMSVEINKGSEGNLSFVAHFTRKVYYILINYDGGSASNASSFTSLSEDISLNKPIKLGYNFVGWRDVNGNVENDVVIESGTKENKSYTAVWEPIEYILKLNVDGEIQEIRFNIESEDIEIPNPVKQGYTFLGWSGYGQAKPQTNYVLKKGSVGTTELTATWEKTNSGILLIVLLPSLGGLAILIGVFFFIKSRRNKNFDRLERI